MSELRDWLHAVAAAHTAGADTWTDGRVTVRRVTGGANNALYRVEIGGQRYACKLCVADERQRAAREYGALRLLHAAGLDIAPQPLWLDKSCTILPFPTVVYRWLPGEPLNSLPTAQQLAALLESYDQMHALRYTEYERFDLPTAWFHWFDFAPYLAELRGFLAKYGSWLATTEPDGQDLRDRLVRLVDSCTEALVTATVDPGRGRFLLRCFSHRVGGILKRPVFKMIGRFQSHTWHTFSSLQGKFHRSPSQVTNAFPLRLCRVDPNLANSVWGDDGRLRWVDWEFSGWGDPALDVAELRWHAALAELSEPQQAWLRENYRRPADDPGFGDRLVVWDRLLVTRWPFLILRWLWSEHHGPDRLRLTQPSTDPSELRARLVRFVERAERFAGEP
jgi:hypothetical protein